MTAAIELNTWASFAGTTDDAHIAGDVAMLEPEVNPVISVLRRNWIEVVALHHHMLGEEPWITFLHYYGGTDHYACPGLPRRAERDRKARYGSGE